jgi:hypothetical protein
MVQSHGTPSQYQPPKLLEQVREAIRARHYSLRTVRRESARKECRNALGCAGTP